MNRIIYIMLILTSMIFTCSSNAAEKESITDQVTLAENSPQLTSLKVELVTEIIAPSTEPLNGKITLDENYTARLSSPILGRAISINAQIGEKVKRGQVLMTMDSPELDTAVADARKADADLQLKRKIQERNNLLLEGGVIARKDQESSQSDLLQAEAEAQRANARLKSLGVQRNASDKFTLRAPIAGIIVDRQVNPSTEIRPDATNPLFIITNPDHLWASIDVPERDLNKVFKGQSVLIEVDAYPEEVFNGSIESIGVMLDSTTRRISVRCSLLGKGKLKPEMYARITPLNNKKNKVIRLTNTALITEGLYNYVFVEVSGGHFKKRRVTLNSQERDYATIKNGLNVGEKVVTTGAILLNSELAVGR